MSRAAFKPSLTEEFVRWLYSIALLFAVLLLPLLRPFLKKVNIKFNRERFGFIQPKGKRQAPGGILLHCASVGEVVSASPLVKKIQQQYPDIPITITTTTETGAEQVRQSFKRSVVHYFLPFDLSFMLNRLLKLLKPSQVLITEVELWPNLIHQSWKQHIPVTIINARLTDKSLQNYQSRPRLFGPMFKKLTSICAQGQRDYENYQQLGIDSASLFLTNNMKFDLQLSDEELLKAKELQAELQISDRKVLLGASTHDTEETALIESYQTLKTEFPQLLLILVPRHPQRFADVEKLLSSLNNKKLSDSPIVSDETDCLLVDQMGVLKTFYFMSDIAFVGGSLANKGGHNALEAALFSKPVVMGPHIYNNPAICESLIQAGALEIVQNKTELTRKIKDWLENPQICSHAGNAGFEVIRTNSGAIDKTIALLDLNSSVG